MTTPLPVRLVQGLERSPAVDRYLPSVRVVADQLVGYGRRRRVLLGTDLGHALHPVLTDLPIGLWTSAWALDLVGGPQARPAATRLMGLGVLTAAPTALTGWAEWREADLPAQRVGVVHAACNAAGIGLLTVSWLARRRGNHTAGVLFGMAGATAATVGGFLGGHLAGARKVGSRHPAFERDEADPSLGTPLASS